jgi:uncharacterized membrane-anchored protein YitT (DUF2179 family)
MIGGGVTGLGAIIQYATGFDVSYSYFLINAILLLMALKVLGFGFGVKTVYAIFVTSFFLKIIPAFIPTEFAEMFVEDNGKLFCAIIAGIISGGGIAITFTQGGSTGGTDIVALMVTKYKAISPGAVIAICDYSIMASSLIIPNGEPWTARIMTLLYGFVLAGVSSFTIDRIFNGSNQSSQIFIFSNKYAEISTKINEEAHRGVTLLDSVGWYTKNEGKVIVAIVRKNEVSEILDIATAVDPTAFISVTSTMGVYGIGFDKLKK